MTANFMKSANGLIIHMIKPATVPTTRPSAIKRTVSAVLLADMASSPFARIEF
jgi:hypothetical protein